MDSDLTKILKSGSNKFIGFIDKKINVSTQNIIAYSVILNAFAVLNLLKDNIGMFIALFLTAFYSQIMAKTNKFKKNDSTSMVRLFGRMSIWLMLTTVFYGVYSVYKKYISFGFLFIFIIVLIICNVNYSLKILEKVEKNEFENRGDINSIVINKWASMFKYISKEKREHLSFITKFFDETMVILYFCIGVLYLEYIRNKTSYINL